jgi:hypothetical protein
MLRNCQSPKVRPFIVAVSKWIEDRRRRDIENRPCNGIELQFGNAIDDQPLGHALECGCRDHVACNVLRPGHERMWFHTQFH